MPNIRRFIFNAYAENTYVLSNDKGECLVFDPGAESPEEQEKFFGSISDVHPLAVLLTHGHPDHTACAAQLQKRFGIPVYMNPADKIYPGTDQFSSTGVKGGDRLSLAGFDIEVFATPGHTPGGVCYYLPEAKILLSGDTLFRGTIGRTDLPGGEYDDLIRSLMDGIMGLDGDVRVFPGHADSTTIADERTENPFLQPFNEPEEEIRDEDIEPIFLKR